MKKTEMFKEKKLGSSESHPYNLLKIDAGLKH